MSMGGEGTQGCRHPTIRWCRCMEGRGGSHGAQFWRSAACMAPGFRGVPMHMRHAGRRERSKWIGVSPSSCGRCAAII
eukprot:111724-Chlamydomonas_euryale.AAC.1